ncbi:hypothetical protein NIES2111_28070 [Nostoc sp. NIES-2111]|nr:hypothetical protein NIES2111_28070 [Nostoc sp. NIES-2111]
MKQFLLKVLFFHDTAYWAVFIGLLCLNIKNNNKLKDELYPKS